MIHNILRGGQNINFKIHFINFSYADLHSYLEFLNQYCCCIVVQSCLTLPPHGLQHTRPPCPSPSPRVCPSSHSLHWWCHPAISSSDILFSFCSQSFPASWTFPMSCLFVSDDQNIGASASVLPVNIQGSTPVRLTGLISLLSKGVSGVFCSTTVWRHQFFAFCLLYGPVLSSSHKQTWPVRRS